MSATLWAMAAAMAAATVPLSARAATPQVAVERYLEVQAASAQAASRAFELARAVEPECPAEYRRWSFGIHPFPVTAEPPRFERASQLRDRLLNDLRARPGDYVFLSDQQGTPFAEAGVRRGDRLTPPAQDAAASPSATEPARDPMWELRTHTLAELKQVSAALQAQPERRYTLWRGDESRQIRVRAVPVCGILFVPVDSQHAYAGAEGNSIHATLPLINELSEKQLMIVLAHETAHVALGSSRLAFPVSSMLSDLSGIPGPLGLVGALSKIRDNVRKNSETGAESPGDEALVKADRLALQLLASHGITPNDYLAFWHQREAVEVSAGAPTYRRSRPLSNARLLALESGLPREPARVARISGLLPTDSAAVSFKAGDLFVGPGVLTIGHRGSRKHIVLPAGEWLTIAAVDHPSNSGRVEMTSVAFGRLVDGRVATLLRVTANRSRTSETSWTHFDTCERPSAAFRLHIPPRGIRQSCAVAHWSPQVPFRQNEVSEAERANLKQVGAPTTGPVVVTTWLQAQFGLGYMLVERVDWPALTLDPVTIPVEAWTSAGLDAADARGAYLRGLRDWATRYGDLVAKGFERAFDDEDLVPGHPNPATVLHSLRDLDPALRPVLPTQ